MQMDTRIRGYDNQRGLVVTPIECGGVTIKIDLGAERLLAAERGEDKIAIEIKSFVSPSPISEFHTAWGQFVGYRRVLRDQQPERVLFLSVPVGAYKEFFVTDLIQNTIIISC